MSTCQRISCTNSLTECDDPFFSLGCSLEKPQRLQDRQSSHMPLTRLPLASLLSSDPKTSTQASPAESPAIEDQDNPASSSKGDSASAQKQPSTAPAEKNRISLFGRMKDSHHDQAEDKDPGQASRPASEHQQFSEGGRSR